jgi:cysteine desulfurase/selenocysteine lyase
MSDLNPPVLQSLPFRDEFPELSVKVHGHDLVYLDNASSTLKPMAVLDAERNFYTTSYANVHRGVHHLSQVATEAYEDARRKVADFIVARSTDEIIFTKGTTESINLVANSWGTSSVGSGDEILVSAMEHHANLVPWQMLCQRSGATLQIVPLNDAGELDLQALDRLLSPRTKLVAMVWVSNILGTVNPIEDIIDKAHRVGAKVLVDAAQAIAHRQINVQSLGADFLCFSSHKMFGPTGIGVLYGRREYLSLMPPWQGGGDMIREVEYTEATYADPPLRFEAGTPPITQAIGLGAAIDCINRWSWPAIQSQEEDLYAHLQEVLDSISGLRRIGFAQDRIAVQSFLLGDAHPYDVGMLLDSMGIAVRTGHHCGQPLMKRLGIPGTVRASLSIYNTHQEIEHLGHSLRKAARMLGIAL